MGFIQLIAVGNESDIFNHSPHISFFKTYYRRYCNFFINNMTIEGKNVSVNQNNLTSSKIITFKIPKNGDLLGKSYIELKFDDYYFELFEYNGELYSTLNTNILNLYDNYYIKTNTFSITDIQFISTIKLNYYLITNNSNFSTQHNKNDKLFIRIMSSNINNTIELINLINNYDLIELETDENNVFYNLDLINNFYSFNVFYTSNILNICNDKLFIYLFDQINIKMLKYIQIDMLPNNLSFRVGFENSFMYMNLLKLMCSQTNIAFINDIRINDTYVYFSCKYVLNLYNELIEIFFNKTEVLELEIIRDKIKSTNMTIVNDIIKKMNMLILNKNADTIINIVISNHIVKSYAQLTIMVNSMIFGNLTNEFYNDFLIRDSNELLNIFNLTNNKMSINLLIRIYITLMCSDISKLPTIQQFLKIVNNTSQQKMMNLSYYLNNANGLNELNEKILNIIVDPNLIIVSNKIFYILCYTQNTYKFYDSLIYVVPFTDKKISIYTSTITNFYLFSNFISTFSNYFNQISNDFGYIVTQLLFITDYLNVGSQGAIYNKTIQLNYLLNNNMFNLTSTDALDMFDFVNDKIVDTEIKYENLYLILVSNFISLYITQSLTILNTISNKASNSIYTSTGNLTSLFDNNNNSLCVVPMSSYMYVYTNNEPSICASLSFTNSDIYFNKSMKNYLTIIQNNLETSIYKLVKEFKINIANDIEIEISNALTKTKLYTHTKNYYTKSINILNENNMNTINTFLDKIKNINYSYVYHTNVLNLTDLNNEIMLNIFSYTDFNLYSQTFSNLYFYKDSNCNSPPTYTNLIIELNYLKFIFLASSPLYRIYFLFTFLSKYTSDQNNNNSLDLSDVVALRDFSLMFLLSYLNFANEYDTTPLNVLENLLKFNFKYIKNQTNILSDNLICFDKIDLINDNDFLNKIKNKNSNSYFMMYNNFYFTQTKIDTAQINITSLNEIPNICNNLKYNFDDKIIILFLKELNSNNYFFYNFNRVYNFVLNFFNKYEYDVPKLFNSFYDIINYNVETINLTNNNEINIFKDEFYSQCYYTTFTLGSAYDNTYLNNTTTINNLFNLTLSYDLNYSYEYCIQSYNIKQNINYLSTDNILVCLNYFLSQLYSIFYSVNK